MTLRFKLLSVVCLIGNMLSGLCLAAAADTSAQPCLNNAVTPSYEEQRLVNVLVAGGTPFAEQILAASGFAQFAPQFAQSLCDSGKVTSFDAANALVKASGIALWQAAVDRVQGVHVTGDLPRSDDRMLYWARLKMTLALRQWQPAFALSDAQREQLQWTLERASRGQLSMQFPSGPGFKRIILSGFDPFTLGTPGAAHPDTHIRIGNPSGAIALALNGRRFNLPDGRIAVIQTYLLPVSYGPFRKGMQEHTLAPFFTGPDHVQASLTLSQGGKGVFWIENWHGRYHATNFPDNEGVTLSARLPSAPDADIYPPADVLGYDPLPWNPRKPAQFIETTLPVAAMINARSGAQVINASTGQKGGYPVIWHTNFTVFADCNALGTQDFNTPPPASYPPPTAPVAPLANACAHSGGGGNYLSNESGYRNTLLRDTLAPTIAAGHLHVPVMTVFAPGDDDKLTDAMFESYRDSIVEQATGLIEAVTRAAGG